MKCTPEHIHELEIRIQHGETAAAMELCNCLMPEIRASTRPSGRMQVDAIQEVCETLIIQATEKISGQNQN